MWQWDTKISLGPPSRQDTHSSMKQSEQHWAAVNVSHLLASRACQEESGSLHCQSAPRTAGRFSCLLRKYSSFFWLWRFLTLGARPSSALHPLEFIQNAQIGLRSLGAMLISKCVRDCTHQPETRSSIDLGIEPGNSSSPDELRHEGKFCIVLWTVHLTEGI